MHEALDGDRAGFLDSVAVGGHGAAADEQRCFRRQQVAQALELALQLRIVLRIDQTQGDGTRLTELCRAGQLRRRQAWILRDGLDRTWTGLKEKRK